ncbi:MAG: hypothetical protein AB1762_17595 [Gemmatimonadota bacterium]
MPLEIGDVLAHLRGVRKSGDQWSARCPLHDDNRASLSVGVGIDGKILLHCHANKGCSPDRLLAWMTDLTPKQARLSRRIVEKYDYYPNEGPRYRKIRYDPKGFSWESEDGYGGWKPGL